MNVYKALSELYAEKKRLDIAISALEKRLAADVEADGAVRGRRGRHSMSAEERKEVSRRMSRYWASRRASAPDFYSSTRLTESAQEVSGSGVRV